jgi:hypothetical protein
VQVGGWGCGCGDHGERYDAVRARASAEFVAEKIVGARCMRSESEEERKEMRVGLFVGATSQRCDV